MKTYDEMVTLFEKANTQFLKLDQILFAYNVSERTLCGALMVQLHDIMSIDETLAGYYVDVEYNRNKGGRKPFCKTIADEQHIRYINCDLIVHSRGECVEQDNLLAIEMKKSYRCQSEKDKDRKRLIALTKESFDDVWTSDGSTLPEHVCRYVLGIYYEIDYSQKQISIEYYRNGHLENKHAHALTE